MEPMYRMRILPLVLILALVGLVGCPSPDATPTPEAPAVVPETGIDDTPVAPPDEPAAPATQEVTIQLSAQNIEFDQDTITVPAGARVVMEFINHDPDPHNFALYETEEAQNVIFQGEIITGPDETITYEFDAPEEPGTYFFRCDPHPVQMTGQFIVQ
jgi:plastocyanin